MAQVYLSRLGLAGEQDQGHDSYGQDRHDHDGVFVAEHGGLLLHHSVDAAVGLLQGSRAGAQTRRIDRSSCLCSMLCI